MNMPVPLSESLLASPTLLVLNVRFHRQYSASTSSRETILPSIVHERHPGGN